mmetsp:Transcript_30286/g.55938  ORF Transcript_30286/g.55938 Transcript_30286/m.55938 type:complete len:104 (-) Transcript_30286:93-404(-)
MAPTFSHIEIISPGALAKNTNKSNVINEYANQPIVFPVMNAHGVGLRFPNEPLFMEDFSDFIGAANAHVDRMAPIVGHTYSAIIKTTEGMLVDIDVQLIHSLY